MEEGRLHELVNRQDESLKSPQHQDFVLSILFDKDGFSFSVFDHQQKKHKALVRCSLQLNGMHNARQIAESFMPFWKQHSLSKLYFNKILFLDALSENTLIPKAFYDERYKDMAFDAVCTVEERKNIRSDSVLTGEIHNLYAEDPDIMQLNGNLFEGRASYRHHITNLCDNIQKYLPANSFQKNIFINVRNRSFDVIIFDQKKLIFANSFSYQSKEDFIYFILFVFEQHHLDPEKDKVFLSGDIMRNSNLHKMLEKYVRYSDFIKRNDTMKYAYFFDEIPDHLYFSLLNSATCV